MEQGTTTEDGYFTGRAETQVWVEVALRCNYIGESKFSEIDSHYDRILGKLVRMMDNPKPWLIVRKKSRT